MVKNPTMTQRFSLYIHLYVSRKNVSDKNDLVYVFQEPSFRAYVSRTLTEFGKYKKKRYLSDQSESAFLK